jgi:hypothetical protein
MAPTSTESLTAPPTGLCRLRRACVIAVAVCGLLLVVGMPGGIGIDAAAQPAPPPPPPLPVPPPAATPDDGDAADAETGEDGPAADADEVDRSPERVRELIDLLAHPDPATRDAAMRLLAAIGEPAIDQLEDAAAGANLEVRWRARQALQLCRWAVTPDLEEVAAGLDEWLRSDSNNRRRQLQRWHQQHGGKLEPFLRRVIERDSSLFIQREAFERLLDTHRDMDARTEELAPVAAAVQERGGGAAVWAWVLLAKRTAAQNGEEGRERAIRWLDALVDAGAGAYEVHAARAEVLEGMEKWGPALEAHRRARALATPQSELEHAQRIAVLLRDRLGREDEGLEILRDVVIRNPRDPAAMVTLVEYYLEADRTDDILTLLASVKRSWSENPRLLRDLTALITRFAQSFWKSGAFAEMSPIFRTLVDLHRAPQERIDVGQLRDVSLALAWAEVAAGNAAAAADALRAADGYLSRSRDRAVLVPAARMLGLVDVADELTATHAAGIPVTSAVVRADFALWRRDVAEAAQLLDEAAAAVTAQPGGPTRLDLWRLWHLADRLGDVATAGQLLDEMEELGPVEEPVYDAQTPAVRIDVSDRRVAAELADGARLAAARIELDLIDQLAAIGRFQDASDRLAGLADKTGLDDSEIPGDIARRIETREIALLIALGQREKAELLIADRAEPARRDVLLIESAVHAGDFDEAARLLADAAAAESRVDGGSALAAADWSLRLGRIDEIDAQLGDLSTNPGRREVLRIAGRLTAGDVRGADELLMQLIDRNPGLLRDFAVSDSRFIVEWLLRLGRVDEARGAVLGGEDVASLRRAWTSPGNSAAWLFAPQTGVEADYGTCEVLYLHGLMLAAAGETADALAAMLAAAQMASLDDQADRIDAALRELAQDGDALATAIARLRFPPDGKPRPEPAEADTGDTEAGPEADTGDEPEADPIDPLAAPITDDELTWTDRFRLRQLAHAFLLAGNRPAGLRILDRLTTIGLANRVEFGRYFTAGDDRAIDRNSTADLGVDRLVMLLMPQRIPGAPAAAAEWVTRFDRERAYDLAVALLDRFPDDLRAAILLLDAADALDRRGEPIVQSVEARLAASHLQDQAAAYRAGMWFTARRLDGQAVTAWRLLDGIATTDYFLSSNAQEYLGRLLVDDPARRDEGIALLAASERLLEQLNFQLADGDGLTIIEDGGEAFTYRAWIALAELAEARAEFDATAPAEDDDPAAAVMQARRESAKRRGLTAARLAVIYGPFIPSRRLAAARAMQAWGETDAARWALSLPRLQIAGDRNLPFAIGTPPGTDAGIAELSRSLGLPEAPNPADLRREPAGEPEEPESGD